MNHIDKLCNMQKYIMLTNHFKNCIFVCHNPKLNVPQPVFVESFFSPKLDMIYEEQIIDNCIIPLCKSHSDKLNQDNQGA